MSKLRPDERAELRELVLVACHAILATGHVPSERQLRDRFPGRGPDLLIQLRDELRWCGRLRWNPDPDRARRSAATVAAQCFAERAAPALDAAGRTPAEQRLKRQCEIRAGKMARGEPTAKHHSPSRRAVRPCRYRGPAVEPAAAPADPEPSR
jgi:hypothetical protein